MKFAGDEERKSAEAGEPTASGAARVAPRRRAASRESAVRAPRAARSSRTLPTNFARDLIAQTEAPLERVLLNERGGEIGDRRRQARTRRRRVRDAAKPARDAWRDRRGARAGPYANGEKARTSRASCRRARTLRRIPRIRRGVFVAAAATACAIRAMPRSVRSTRIPGRDAAPDARAVAYESRSSVSRSAYRPNAARSSSFAASQNLHCFFGRFLPARLT